MSEPTDGRCTPLSYTLVWEDYTGARQNCSYFCRARSDALSVVQQLQALSGARVFTLRENGAVLSLDGLPLRQSAAPGEPLCDQIVLSFRVNFRKSLQLKVPAALRTERLAERSRAKVCPLSDVGLLCDKYGRRCTDFRGVRRHFINDNKEPKSWERQRKVQDARRASEETCKSVAVARDLRPHLSVSPSRGQQGVNPVFRLPRSEKEWLRKMSHAKLKTLLARVRETLLVVEADLLAEPERIRKATEQYDAEVMSLPFEARSTAVERAKAVDEIARHRLELQQLQTDAESAGIEALHFKVEVDRHTSLLRVARAQLATLPEGVTKPTSLEPDLLDALALLRAKSSHIAAVLASAGARERTSALAAAHLKRSRAIARSVKVQLDLSPDCPYCGSPLGRETHADHIYPVSHGGLSTWANMVYICVDCNARKRDLTLREFIEKFGLDRGRIEAALARLEKKF